MSYLTQQQVIVRVKAIAHRKSSVDTNGSILWKELDGFTFFEFVADKDLVPYKDKLALRAEIIKPALVHYSEQCEFRYTYADHEIIEKAPVCIQACADEATKIYVNRTHFVVGIKEQAELETVRFQNDALNKILSHFRL
jgi:hypothetical protein